MTKRDIINVNEDIENLLDILLTHVKEDRCNHSIMDLIGQFFDNKIVNGPPSDIKIYSELDRSQEK